MNRPFLYIVFCALLFAMHISAKAQVNLVPNGSFEEHDTCPDNVGQITYAKYWYSPTLGSPDYFNMCTTNLCPNFFDIGIPNNRYGYQYPKTGFGYAGFGTYVSWLDTSSDCIEYLQIKLINPLNSGYKYKLKFQLSVSEISKYTIKNLGVLFSNNSVTNNGTAILNVAPSYLFNQYITDTINWIELSLIYTAIGGEEYLTIGNFSYSQYTDALEIDEKDTLGETYYYIDDVSLTEIEEDIFLTNVFTPNNDGFNDRFIINLRGEIGLIRIYDRWGNKVFEHDVSNKVEWDGDSNGKPCSDGVYYYVLQLGNKKTYKGSIQLLR